jgi:SpoVK/Ycf46/Vps4 family AAA+-type ATPase
MKNKQAKKFVCFLDNYAKNKELTEIDYTTLLSVIQLNYDENIGYDPSMVGKIRLPKRDTHAKKNIANIDTSFNLYYGNLSQSNWNSSNSAANMSSIENNTFSLWHSQYILWQKQHEVALSPTIAPVPKSVEKNKFLQIDASVNVLKDFINIINENEYKPDTDYNIDLKSLHNIKTELLALDSMIGMDSMKKSILDQLIYFIQELHVGKDTSDFKHTVIYGPPGTGKTEIAKIIGKMYSKLGILKNNVFKKVTRNDLIAGYLGQTAIKTKKVIEECLGGVLFIDEAYSLASGSDTGDSYSKECIDIICEALSDHKSNLMVIVAGYEEELNDTFFKVNRGLQSRFIWRFTMDPYTPKELKGIFKKLVLDQEWGFITEAVLQDKWFDERKENFTSYGRDMELLFTYTKIAHGRRVYGKDKEFRKKITSEDLTDGYKTFLTNKKTTKKDPMHLYGVYV